MRYTLYELPVSCTRRSGRAIDVICLTKWEFNIDLGKLAAHRESFDCPKTKQCRSLCAQMCQKVTESNPLRGVDPRKIAERFGLRWLKKYILRVRSTSKSPVGCCSHSGEASALHWVKLEESHRSFDGSVISGPVFWIWRMNWELECFHPKACP